MIFTLWFIDNPILCTKKYKKHKFGQIITHAVFIFHWVSTFFSNKCCNREPMNKQPELIICSLWNAFVFLLILLKYKHRKESSSKLRALIQYPNRAVGRFVEVAAIASIVSTILFGRVGLQMWSLCCWSPSGDCSVAAALWCVGQCYQWNSADPSRRHRGWWNHNHARGYKNCLQKRLTFDCWCSCCDCQIFFVCVLQPPREEGPGGARRDC